MGGLALNNSSNPFGGSGVGQPSAAVAFATSYEVSPVILVGGIANTLGTGQPPNAQLPIAQLLSPNLFPGGATGQAAGGSDINDFFARFILVEGGTLQEWQVATWPLANQAVAANDVIQQPLRLSLRMICPARAETVGYSGKTQVMTNLVGQLTEHINNGGYFTVVTPSYTYTGVLLTKLTDVTDWSPGAQVQVAWQWDFLQPLITNDAALAAQNVAMSRYTSQTGPPVRGAAGLSGSGVVPSASGLIGASIFPSTGNSSLPDISAVSPIAPGVGSPPLG